mmetsp:Transcript_47094/g.108842  ORF Transcript_47094/g.108842 Transcript_47094/m.108842 type:complete len:175 (-) Transcript_47094:88-612(-)
MGIAKRSLEPTLQAKDSGDELDRDSDSDTCVRKRSPCWSCGVPNLGEFCQTVKCPDCQGALCGDCELLAEVCSGCLRSFCRRGDCGVRCVECGALTCQDCSLALYDQKEPRRKCLDCAVARAVKASPCATAAPRTPPCGAKRCLSPAREALGATPPRVLRYTPLVLPAVEGKVA